MAVCIIPARLNSERLPGKLLLSKTGKPLIQHTWEAASRFFRHVVIATDSPEIEEAAKGFRAEVVRTGEHCCGTTRVAEAALAIKTTQAVINLQADWPTVPDTLFKALSTMMTAEGREFGHWPVATVACPITPVEYPCGNIVKVVKIGRTAGYFSRAPIAGAHHHVGVYGYTVGALQAALYAEQVKKKMPTPLMAAEHLEQMYFLEDGFTIGLHVSHDPNDRCYGIDTADDYERFCKDVAAGR